MEWLATLNVVLDLGCTLFTKSPYLRQTWTARIFMVCRCKGSHTTSPSPSSTIGMYSYLCNTSSYTRPVLNYVQLPTSSHCQPRDTLTAVEVNIINGIPCPKVTFILPTSSILTTINRASCSYHLIHPVAMKCYDMNTITGDGVAIKAVHRHHLSSPYTPTVL